MGYEMLDFMEFLVMSEPGNAVHLHPGEPPRAELRLAKAEGADEQRVLHQLEGPPLRADEVEELLQSIAPKDDLAEFQREGMVWFCLHHRGVAVFQVMAFRESGHVRLEVRRSR